MGRILIAAIIVCLCFTTQGFAATFNVSNATEFQNALTTAASNGEDDIINVSAATIILSTNLYYSPAATENHTLTIQGTGYGQTILDGGSSYPIMSLGTMGVTSDNAAHVDVVGITFQNGLGIG